MHRVIYHIFLATMVGVEVSDSVIVKKMTERDAQFVLCFLNNISIWYTCKGFGCSSDNLTSCYM